MVATRFAVAIHILLLLACNRAEGKATSEYLARSVNTNPVVVRRITGQLARAGLLRVRRGPGGSELGRPPRPISPARVGRGKNHRGAPPPPPPPAPPPPARPLGGG